MALLRRRLAVVLAGLFALSAAVCPAAAQETLEAEVRAAFIFNFTKFIDWPLESLAADAFRVCVVGAPRFVPVLDAILAGESVLGRPLVRVAPLTPEGARDCQVLYLGPGEPERGAQMLAAVRDHPTLTIGDSPRFLQQGGAVRFLLEEGRVRFDVSLPALGRARLEASSKLLRVARRVEGVRR
jgi:hypothetical protein